MRVRSVLALLAAMLLFVSACSSGGDELETLGADETSDTTEETTETTDESSNDSDGSEEPDSSNDGSSGDTSEGGDIEDLGDAMDAFDELADSGCMEFALAYSTMFLSALGGMFGSEEDVEAMMEDLEELEASVPDELVDEFAIVSEAWSSYIEELSEVGFLNSGEIDDPMDDPEVEAADAAITDWLEENCEGFSQ